jgi:hypothetical protein
MGHKKPALLEHCQQATRMGRFQAATRMGRAAVRPRGGTRHRGGAAQGHGLLRCPRAQSLPWVRDGIYSRSAVEKIGGTRRKRDGAALTADADTMET